MDARATNEFLSLLDDCTAAPDPDQVTKSALLALPEVSGADAAVVLGGRGDTVAILAAEGASLPAEDLTGLAPDEVPASWREQGIGSIAQHPLPGGAGLLVLAWRTDTTHRAGADLQLAFRLVDVVLTLQQVQDDYADLEARVDNAQMLANMGDYDWHIASDTNRWSDQLYRIYGYEPQSFNATYERFLSMLHPEDREGITAVHQEAYQSGEPYQMTERVLRPDGELRYLASNGQVLMDSGGAPVRMRGTCIDITERVVAEAEREELAGRVAVNRDRERQALELNDSVVQGLVTASYALEMGDVARATDHVTGTLAAARIILDDLLEGIDNGSGDSDHLVRRHSASFRNRATTPATGDG